MKKLQLTSVLILLFAITSIAQETRSSWVALTYGYDYRGHAVFAETFVKNCEAKDELISKYDNLGPIGKTIANDMKRKYGNKLVNGTWRTEFFSSMEDYKKKLAKSKKKIGGINIKNWMTVSAPKTQYSCN